MRLITEKNAIEKIQGELVARLINDWALLTAGNSDGWNTMTIAWGSFGNMWWKPIIDVYVVPTRYTYDFMESGEYFTVSFFPESCHDDLQVLGSKSGRDGDKLASTKLTPLHIENGITFEQADTTLVCRKIYTQALDPEAIPQDVMESTYANMKTHTRFMGEIVAIMR